MKVKRNIFLAIFLVVINIATCLSKGNGPGDPSSLPPDGGEDFPIDSGLVFLMIGGLSLGTVIIYKNKTKKASI